ncbi:protein of unknown function [Hyphomicrobium sp. 1Nfss2.1]|uniref:hypothetical protein n=1 Tax=Hyphomicrobium sp. 1Nfss2.1 TaxID=3413936 RepID=UPI003C7AF384
MTGAPWIGLYARSKPSRPVRLLNPDFMKPGDIILESGTSPLSALIRWFDDGPFSHAVMWLEPALLAEADVTMGVRVFAFTRKPITDSSRYILLRHEDEALAARAAVNARNLAQRRYGYLGAALSKIPSRRGRQSKSKRLFCSQVVARAYREAGAPLFDLHHHVITPNMLLRGKGLRKYTLEFIDAEQLFDSAGTVTRKVKDRNSLPHLDAILARNFTTKAIPYFVSVGKTGPANLQEVLVGAEELQGQALQGLNDLIENEMNAGSMFLDDSAEFKFLRDWLDEMIAHASVNPMSGAMAEMVSEHFRHVVSGWRAKATDFGALENHYRKDSVLKDMSAGRLLAEQFGTRRRAFEELITKVVKLLDLRR